MDNTIHLPKSTTKVKQQWFVGLNTLRFVLAFIVVMGHIGKNPFVESLKAHSFLPVKYIGYLLSVSINGPSAVIAFFIISGFVIHYPNLTGIANLGQYYIRRYIRVVIPLLVITFISYYIGHPDIGNPEKGVVWSLYCELIYYTIYPLLLKLKTTWNIKISISFFIYLVLLIIFCRNDFLSMVYQKSLGYNGSYVELGVGYTWLVGLPCWLMGVKLATEIVDYSENVNFHKIMAFRFLILFIMAVTEVLKFHLFVTYLFTLNFIAVPMYYWIRAEIVYYKFHKPVRLLENWGKFSYSLYLCHPLLLTIIPKIIPVNNYTFLFLPVVIVLLSWVFYKLVEERSHLLAIKLGKQLSVKS